MGSYTKRFAGAEHDLPAWPAGRTPPHAYVIACTPRSGSNLLGDLLRLTGVAGLPMEYLETRVAARVLGQRWGARGLGDYLTAAVQHRTTPNGAFGVKVHYHQLAEVAAGAAGTIPEKATPHGLLDFIEAWLPGARWVHLQRNDRAQAVSMYRAHRTGNFAIFSDEARDAADPPYDFTAIREVHEWLDRWARAWTAFFDATSIAPLRVGYEELVRDPDEVIGRVADHLGTRLPAGPVPVPTTQRQAVGRAAEMVERYREDLVKTVAAPGRPSREGPVRLTGGSGPGLRRDQ